MTNSTLSFVRAGDGTLLSGRGGAFALVPPGAGAGVVAGVDAAGGTEEGVTAGPGAAVCAEAFASRNASAAKVGRSFVGFILGEREGRVTGQDCHSERSEESMRALVISGSQ